MALRVDRLRSLRERHGWSQRALARHCNIAEAAIRRYESGIGEPSTTSLKLIAETLKVSADYLIGLTDEPLGHFGDGEISHEESQILNIFRREGWPGVFRLGVERLPK